MIATPSNRSVHYLSFTFLVLGICSHLLMLGSLLSEPFAFEHGINLSGSKSHPQEKEDVRGFLDSWFHDTDRVPRGLDFFSIYQAGRNFLRGQSVYYGVRVHRMGDESLVVPYFSGFRYLPVYAVVYGSALNALPPWSSYWTWIIIVELLLLSNLMALRWLNVSPAIHRMLIGMWLMYSPYYIELHIGQQSMVTVSLIHICIIAHLRQRRILRDAGYIGSVLWKINTVLFLPVWIKFRRWRTILFLFLLSFGLSLPYFLLVEGSFQEFSSYFHHKFIPVGPNSLGFWALSVQFLQSARYDHSTIRSIMSIWSLGIIGISCLATFLPRRIRFTDSLAMWICVYFLTYQYVWEHHYVMMLPVITAGMVDKNLRKWTGLLWIFCAMPTPYLFFNISSQAMPQLQWAFWKTILYHSTKIIPLLVFFLIILFRNFQTNSQNTGSEDDECSDDQIDVFDTIKRWSSSWNI